MAAAGDQLLGLREELDLANAAAAELDVVAFDRDVGVAAIGVDLALERLDVGDRREVEILPPDERRKLPQDVLAGPGVAGADARLDHRRALPVLPDAAVVVERGFGRDRDLGRGRIGAQPQIDAEHIAVGGALLQKLHQAARDAHMERRGLVLVGERGRIRIVEDDEIDIAGVVELERAHLAHRQHDVAATLLGRLPVGGLEPAARHRLAEQEPHRRDDRRVRHFGQRTGRLHHRPDAADVGERDQQRGFSLHPAQEPHGRGFVPGGRRGLAGLRQQFGQAFAGIGLEDGEQAVRLGGGQFPEIGRSVGETRAAAPRPWARPRSVA